MRKTITKETVREYDKDGKLVSETVTETEETDDGVAPVWTPWSIKPACGLYPPVKGETLR